jgi:hypothetical protein
MASRHRPGTRRVHPMSAPTLTFTVATLPSPLGGMLVATDG